MRPAPDAGGAVIVGCGRIAGGYNEHDDRQPLTHVVAVRQAGMEVLAAVDRDATRAHRFADRWRVARHTDDLDAALADVRPTLVNVCTGPEAHAAALRSIVACPSVNALIVEKPLGGSASEAAALAAMLRAWGRPVVVNYFRAFDPAYRRIGELVRGAHWGPLREIVGRYYGAAAQNASHLVERLLDWCGTPRRIQVLEPHSEAPRCVLEFAGGVGATLLPSAGLGYHPFEFDLLFERGRVRIVDGEQRVEVFAARADPLYPGFENLTPDTRTALPAPTHASFAASVAAAVGAARGGTLEVETLERAVDTARVLERVLDGVPAR